MGISVSTPVARNISYKICESLLWGKVLCVEDNSWFRFWRKSWVHSPFHYIVKSSSLLFIHYRRVSLYHNQFNESRAVGTAFISKACSWWQEITRAGINGWRKWPRGSNLIDFIKNHTVLKRAGSWQLLKAWGDYSSASAEVFLSRCSQVTIQHFHIPAELCKLPSFARKSL